MKDKIKKLTEIVALLSKLMLKVIEFLGYITLAEMTVKTMIQIWTKL